MNGSSDPQLCSIMNCPLEATESESGRTKLWEIVIHYCGEHAREAEKGTPLGPVGIDPCRVTVSAIGSEEPTTRGAWPGIA